jgi:hypothetical protein
MERSQPMPVLWNLWSVKRATFPPPAGGAAALPVKMETALRLRVEGRPVAAVAPAVEA